MFEYLLDPRDVCSIRDISFTFDELERIEDVTTNIMSDDYEFQGFLESYEDPFWTVYSIPSKKKLKLEIHSVIDNGRPNDWSPAIGDIDWIKEKFAEYVKRAFELIFEEAFMKQRKGGKHE
jgi:hypothetical protein